MRAVRPQARARVYADLRTAQLERAPAMVPATLLYGSARYDFDPSYAEGLDVVRTPSVLHLMHRLLRSQIRVLEVNEPGMAHGVERAALAIACCRSAAYLRGTTVKVVTYAIGNSDPFAYRTARLTGRIRKVARRQLSRWVCGQLDRIAFGTAAAQELYDERWRAALRTADSRLVPALPAPCICPTVERCPDQVLFLGALLPRKGLPELLEAWPKVVAQRPSARLVVIGKGALVETVYEAATRDPSITVVVDPPRREIHRRLREASALVLLSQPEQVGLPIVEALAHGCRVVASDATGLASWLRAHDHCVLSASATAQERARAIATLLERNDAGLAVTDDLPGDDGRTAADRWLMA